MRTDKLRRYFKVILCTLIIFSYIPNINLSKVFAASNGIFPSTYSPIATVEGGSIAIDPNLEVTIADQNTLENASVIINNFHIGDILHFTNQNGISGSYNENTGVLTLTGNATIENYQEALRSVTYSTTATSLENRTITFTIGNALYYEPTQHFYEFITTTEDISWSEAKKVASERSLFGKKGYLATLTSEGENNFVKEKTTGQGWIGASDDYNHINLALGQVKYTSQSSSEGKWSWVTGPEKGTQFWNGNSPGSPVDGNYNNWNTGEPNNNSGEHYAHIYGQGDTRYGKWNDFPNNLPVKGYIVEYGGLSTDTEESILLTMNKTVQVLKAQPNLGFEADLKDWTTYGTVSIGTGAEYPTGDGPKWTVNPYQTKMAVLVPSGSSGVFSTVADTLMLSDESRNYITSQFSNTTNFAYIYQDIQLETNEEFTMAWNYVAFDYEPFNDASFVSLVNTGNPANNPIVNGVKAQLGILGATVKGTGNYSTGSYGSTGWQVATFKAGEAGTYRLGFAVYNLDDTALSPYLFVDKEQGVTLKNGEPFGPIPKDENAPPPAGEVMESTTPNVADIIANATDDFVIVNNVPTNTTVKVYKNNNLVATQNNVSGTVTFENVELLEGEEIEVSFTEEGKEESVKTSKTAQEESTPVNTENIIANATTDEVIVKGVPANTIVKVYNLEDPSVLIGQVTSGDTEGDVTVKTDLGITADQVIAVTVTEPGKFESDLTNQEAKNQSNQPISEEVDTNATKDEVSVHGVPQDATVTVYDESGTVIGQATSINGIDPVIVNIEDGLSHNQVVKVTITSPDEIESEELTVTATLEYSTAPNANDITVNATDDIVTVNNAPTNSTVKVYKNNNLVATQNNVSGTVTFESVALDNGEAIEVSFTEENKLESAKTSKTAQEESTPVDSGDIIANATTGEVIVKGVPANTIIKVYSQDNPSVLLGQMTNGNSDGDVIVETDPGITAGQIIAVTVTVPDKIESDSTNQEAKNQSNPPSLEGVAANATKDEILVNWVPKDATVTVYNESGTVIGQATSSNGIDPVTVNIEEGLSHNQAVKVTITSPGELESEALTVTGQVQSNPLESIQLAASSTTNVVRVNDVPPGGVITIYDTDGTVLGTGTNENSETSTVKTIICTKRLNDQDTLFVSIRELGELESEKQTTIATDTSTPVKNRYIKAGGNTGDDVYQDVVNAEMDLTNEIASELQDEVKIVSLVKTLKNAIAALEEASVAKELENAIAAANKAKEQAEKAKTRYTDADGEETIAEYQAVEETLSALNEALAAEPQDTKAIEDATSALNDAIAALEEASAAKELGNAIAAANEAILVARDAQEYYNNVAEDKDNEIYTQVSSDLARLEEELKTNIVTDIQEAILELIESTKELANESNSIVKMDINKKINEAKTMEDVNKIAELIQNSRLEASEKKELLGLLVDKVLNQDSGIKFEQSSDILLLKSAIEASNKTNKDKEAAYILLAQKGIAELAQPDTPTKDSDFQKEENLNIENVINLVTDSSEREILKSMHRNQVDTLSLTKETAFTFEDNDSWESITSQFLLLSKGAYGSSINWKSSNSTVISVTGEHGTVNRQSVDKVVILTAQITIGTQKHEKPFLLVVKSNTPQKKEYETVKREVEVTVGYTETTPQVIQRINLVDEKSGLILSRIDKLVVSDSLIPTETDGATKIYLADDKQSKADELAIEIPSKIVQRINGTLELKTDQGSIFLSNEALEGIKQDGIDLYFRIVPIRELDERKNVIDRTKDNPLVQMAIADEKGNAAKILGTPREIETNYSGFETEVILPLEDVLYNDINIDNLRVFIEHTDGEKEVVKGEIVYENGNPVGIKFKITKFSTFTVFEVVNKKIEEDTDKAQPNEKDIENGSPAKVTQPAQVMEEKEAAENKLPKTATSQYNWIILGALCFLFGLILIVLRRFRSVKE